MVYLRSVFLLILCLAVLPETLSQEDTLQVVNIDSFQEELTLTDTTTSANELISQVSFSPSDIAVQDGVSQGDMNLTFVISDTAFFGGIHVEIAFIDHTNITSVQSNYYTLQSLLENNILQSNQVHITYPDQLLYYPLRVTILTEDAGGGLYPIISKIYFPQL